MEIAGRPRFLHGRFTKRIPDLLPIILIGKVPPAQLLADEEEVILAVLHLRLLLNGRHVTLLIVKTVPSQIPVLTRCPLDRMNQAECPGGTDLHDHRVERKPYAVIKGRSIDRYTFWGRPIHSGVRLRDHKTIPCRQKDRLFLATAPLSEYDLPKLLNASLKEELVDAPSEEELVDTSSEEELVDTSSEKELVDGPSLVKLLVWSPHLRGGLGFGHSAFLIINHTEGSYVNFPRIRNLFLNTKNARGGGILTTRPRGGDGLKCQHHIGNPFGLPSLILWEDVPYHPTINWSREAEKLWVAAHRLGVGLPLRDIPTQ
ncbi:hypothetical protein Cgig2_025658 [Carnegiea gigantea]|uniref:Uncharacterized protein n=1 Tax=Carnegiea gigantea TaxID=171969 RepID=A0A9Q1JTH9_9CARY|nr:hypothetical protein Cgig2_025658 [Carnegiea gigantea]